MIENKQVLFAGLVFQGAGEPAFANAAPAHDILRKNSPSRLSSDIRIILAPVNALSPCDVSCMRVVPTL
jgi:hypothetical protein